jgi:hypothetical protein
VKKEFTIEQKNLDFNIRKEQTNLLRLEYDYQIQEQEFDLRIDQAKFEPVRLENEKNKVLAGLQSNMDGIKAKIKNMKEELNNG